jgi:photosystem II stability/assembly factor-like uncharacterized protein
MMRKERLVFYMAFTCALLFSHAKAFATAYEYALNTPAIAVKAPSSVVLIAAANAGKRVLAVGEHGVIIYSDDNGRSWQQSKVPVDVTLTSVGFASATEGWVTGHDGVILHTSDGGVTWQNQLNGFQANQLTLAAAKQAVLDHNPSPGTALAVRRANLFTQAGADKPFLTMLITDNRSVSVFGAYRLTMKTSDGGKNWADSSLNIADPLSHNLYDVTRTDSGIYLAGEDGEIFRSTDGGQQFTALPTPTGATLFSVTGTGDGGVFVCGVAGQAFLSVDDGASWKTIALNTQSNLTDAYLLKSGAVVVLSESGDVYVSYDHGNNFTKLAVIEPMALYGMTEAPNGDLVLVGSSGILKILAENLSRNSVGG